MYRVTATKGSKDRAPLPRLSAYRLSACYELTLEGYGRVTNLNGVKPILYFRPNYAEEYVLAAIISASSNRALVFKRSLARLPGKCLVQLPARFALGMIERGWILRNEVIWHKPNCLPQSARDRFTVDFERLFFFVKPRNHSDFCSARG